MSELFDAVLQHLQALGREETTLVGYRQIARDTAARLGRKQLRKLKASDLDAFYGDLLRSGRSPARVRRYHSFVRRCLEQGVRWEWVGSNVADRASPPPEPKRHIEIQEADAVVRLITLADASREPELGIAFRMLAATGSRRGEVCGLQWRDLDFGTGVCRIRRSVKRANGRLLVGSVKTHQERSVQLDPVTVALLTEHRRRLDDRAALAGCVLVATAFVLTDAVDGEASWDPNRLTQAFGRLRERAGFEGRLHDLRHWHASQLLSSGEAPIIVAERLGHSDPSTTHRWYAHAMPRADARAARLIGEALTDRNTS